MKYQALFSSQDKSKKLKRHLLQFLFGALKVKIYCYTLFIRKGTTFVASLDGKAVAKGTSLQKLMCFFSRCLSLRSVVKSIHLY